VTSANSTSNTWRQIVPHLVAQPLKAVIWPLLGVLTVLLIGWSGIVFIGSHTRTGVDANVVNLIIGGLQNVSELTVATTSGKATVVIKDEKQLFGIPIGDTNLVYEGVGKIQAGINLADIQVKQIDAASHTIHLVLPPPTIADIGLDVDRSSILANYRRWFAPKPDPALQEQAERAAIAQIKAQACDAKILEIANRNAKQQIEHVLTTLDYHTIQIDTQTTEGCAEG